MALISIDPEKCTRDGICAAVCPAQLIEFVNKEEIPRPIDDAEEICINCGHCVTACPHAALTLKTMKPEDLPVVRPELEISEDQAVQFLRSRRSIRCFKNKEVPEADLVKLIELARYAPTGHNSQPLEYLVIKDPMEVKRLAGIVVDWMSGMVADKNPFALEMRMDRVVSAWENGYDRICRGAPHLILAHAPKTSTFAQTSGPIAMAYMELFAKAMGLGACWGGYVNAAALLHPPVAEALALPEGHLHYGIMMIGYPKFKYYRLPDRNEPKITWR